MIWFTADLHLNHQKALEFAGRDFPDTAAMDELLIHNINRYVRREDELYVLGDFCWGARFAGHYRQRIKCRRVHMIWGNHDKESMGRVFTTRRDVAMVKTHMLDCTSQRAGEFVSIWLSHYPHCYWPKSHWGAPHLYGHMHRQREELLDSLFPGRRAMDVGVDAVYKLVGEYRPMSEFEVVKMLLARPGHDPISYYRGLETEDEEQAAESAKQDEPAAGGVEQPGA